MQMGWKELAASLFTSLVSLVTSLFASLVSLGWPVAVVVLALVLVGKFRAEVVELLGRLRKAKVGSTDFDFAARFVEVEESAEQVVLEEEIPEAAPASRSPIDEPVAEMILAFETLSTEIYGLYDAADMPKSWSSPTGRSDKMLQLGLAIRRLRKGEIISPDAETVLNELRSLRNAVVHGHQRLDGAQAIQFVEAAEDMRRYLSEQVRKARGGASLPDH